MTLPTPEPGLVISYSFLWSDEAAAGRVEGSKTRPCAIVLSVRAQDPDTAAGTGQRVYVVPVTHSTPRTHDNAVRLPHAVCRHLGLDTEPSWVVIDEINEFTWPGYDLRPVPDKPGQYAYGFLPPRFFAEILERMRLLRARRMLEFVSR